jgi:hypothetical protein
MRPPGGCGILCSSWAQFCSHQLLLLLCTGEYALDISLCLAAVRFVCSIICLGYLHTLPPDEGALHDGNPVVARSVPCWAACVRACARARMVTRRPGRATTSRHAHTRRAAPCMFRSFVLQGRPSGRSTRTAKDAGTRSRQSLTRPAQHTHPPPSIPSAGVARPLANIAARTHARTGCWSMPRPRSIDRWIWMVHAAYRARMLYARAPLDLLRVN